MMRLYNELLPSWTAQLELAESYKTDEEKVSLSILLASRNVEEETGGPFGAALFDETGHVLSVGVNRVIPLQNAFFHAEFVCLSGALEKLHVHSLPASRAYTLASSAQPCAMCTGALIWAGVGRLLVAASREETEIYTGFDEGPIHPSWKDELKARGIEVKERLLSQDACDVFKRYKAKDLPIYNGR